MGTRLKLLACLPILAACFLQVPSASAVSETVGNITFQCPDGFLIKGADCYLLVDVAMTYTDAEDTCEVYGAELVEIRDEVEAKEVGEMVQTHSSPWDWYWIGNTQNNTEDVCSGFWNQGEPKDVSVSAPFNVAANAPQGRWMGLPNKTRLPFVCRTDACVEGTFRCRNGEKCLSNKWKCDGIYDCEDQSDESDCAASCTYYIYSSTGTLDENSGYSAGKTCTWVIEGAPGHPLSIQFSSINVEEDVDYVEVWSGSPSVLTSKLQERLTGSVTDKTVYGCNNFLIVRLVADVTTQKTGFTATWQTDVELSPGNLQIIATDSWQELTSPYFSSALSPAAYIRQYTVSTDEDSVITLEVIENGLDDGFEYDPDTLSNVNGKNIFPAFYVSRSNTFTIYLVSNGCDGAPEKFNAKVKKGCTVDFTRTNGFILPPNFDNTNYYPPSITCNYTIHAPNDAQRAFQFSFTELRLADEKDSVKVFNGSDSSAPELTPAGNTVFSSTVSDVFVRFVSSLVQTEGFFKLAFNLACPAINNTDNMVVSSMETQYGANVTLSCETGFAFAQEEYVNEASVSITCSLEGKWNVSRMPSCAVIYCGVPEPIPNGFIVTGSGNARYGATVTYECYAGFSMSSSNTSTCGDGSSWSERPSCAASQCGAVSQLTNGSYTTVIGSGTGFGTVIRYSCDPGFDLIGSRFTLCKTDTTWSHQAPVCQRIKCPLPEVAKGQVMGVTDAVEFEGHLTVECSDGFFINGSNIQTSHDYTCLASGQFGFDRDVCVDKDECAGNNPCTGDHEECKNTVGNYTCKCKDKYKMVGSQCQVINRCTAQTSGCDLQNGMCTPTSNEEDYVCKCNQGYVLFTVNGTSGRYIPSSEDGQTPEDVYYLNHTCVPKTCGPPPNVSNGQTLTIKTSFDFGDTVEYRCDFGYELNDSSTNVLTCTESGWSMNTPECESITCGALRATGLVLNIYPNSTTSPGNKVLLECDSESTNIPYNKTLFCAFDKEENTFRLQGDKPHCPAVDCGDVDTIGGASFTLPTSRGLNASFIFNCTSGFVKEGSSTTGDDVVMCEKNGHWGLGNLTCRGTRCTDPGTPGGMNQTKANFEVGGTVVYSCLRRGFTPNPANRTCLYNASSDSAYWDSTMPVCEDVEDPVFNSCPESLVRVKLYGNPSTEIGTPIATDNSGLVKMTVFPEWYGNDTDVRFDVGSQTVTYTATDASGNSASCSFVVETNDPGTLPMLSCPDYLPLDVNTTSPYSVSLEKYVTGGNDSKLVYSAGPVVTVGPETVGKNVYRVTATNSFGFERQCAFIVDIRPNVCLSTFIETGISSKNAQVECSSTGNGNLSCIVTCNSGFAYQDGSTSITYNCMDANEWTPVLPARSCAGTEDARYIYQVDVVYTFSEFLIANCREGLRTTLMQHIPQQNITFCRISDIQGMKFEVASVDFHDIFPISLTASIFLEVTTDSALVSPERYEICQIELAAQHTSGVLFDVSSTPVTCTAPISSPQSLTSTSQTVIKNGNSCLTGRVLANIGSTEKCVQCEPGNFFNGSLCIECADGEYQDLAGQTQCKPCENGASLSTQPRVSSDQCVASCPPGFNNSQTSSAMPAQCLACPEDSYLGTEFTAFCIPCNTGTTTSGTEGATSQDQCTAQCSAGHYPVDNRECASCPPGYYKSGVGNVACTSCKMNETTQTSVPTSSSDCVTLTIPDTFTCQNGGVPSVDFHRMFCSCPDGYSGEQCEVAVNPCDSSPCYNGGTCTSTSPTAFTCACPFERTCDMVPNDVSYDADKVYLDVISADINGCKKLCTEMFVCAVIIHDISDNCLLHNATEYTNGTKSPNTDTYLKACSQQYLFEGTRCETDTRNDCTNDTCEDRSFCRDLIDSADCVCPSDSKYMQPRCETDLNVCDPSPCQNGAECKDSGNGVRATCICPAGFDGDQCQNNIDECGENPDGCLHGGLCQDGVDSYSCDCGFYSGSHCENKPDFCNIPDMCVNGLCYNDYNVSSDVCVCEFPFRLGSDGQCTEIDICVEDDPCENNGTCNRVMAGETSCQCEDGYTGSRCQHNIDDCSSNPCVKGMCIDRVSGYRCECDPGYEGVNCANNTDDCQNSACIRSNTERCEDLVQGYKCICKVGFTGTKCETPINECQSFPCEHNGTCNESATPGQYNCTCVDGWTGDNCENLTDFCTPDPCKNGGFCYSLQDSFYCDCTSGTFGETCQDASELCDILHPCTNVSTCKKDGGTADCVCPQYYTGSSCNLIEDSCSNSPCENGGTCIPLSIGYTCQCAEGYSGERCMTKANPCATANCPAGSSCTVLCDKVICLCAASQLKSGSSCKDMSNDFDIYFTKPGKAIRSYQPFYLNQSSFSIMFWIAPLANESPEAPVELRLCNGTTVLAMDKDSVTFGDKPPVLMEDGTGIKTYDLNKWNQVTITWNKIGSYNIFFDGLRLFHGTTDAAFLPLNEPVFIYIGEGFSGYISQLLVWHSTLTYSDSLAMYNDPKIPRQAGDLVAQWTGYRLFDSVWTRTVFPSIVTAATTVCDDGRSGDACNGLRPDKEPLGMPECPDGITFNNTERLVQIGTAVSSDYFNDAQITSNLDSTLLTFGAHRVVFLKKDDENNVAFCRFSVYVKRQGQSCDNLKGLDTNSLATCEGRGQKVQCPNGGRAPLSSNILTCGKLGSYNLDVSSQLPPAVVCGAVGTRTFKVTVSAKYLLGISCNGNAETQVVTALKQKVKDLQTDWQDLCPDSSCDNADVTAKCDSFSSNCITATITINSVPTSLTNRTTNVTLTAKELLQTAMWELKSFDIQNVFNAQLKANTVMISTEPSCAAGYGLVDECVECGKGSFLNETTKMCELCPVGSFTGNGQQTTCTSCPAGQTTLQLGAHKCEPMCSSGHFLNASNQCQKCAKNFYQNETGQVNCLPCPAGKATETTGTKSADLCYDTCDAGTELKNSTCVPCARGFYRDGVTQDQETCEPCPAGNTTAGEGSTSVTHCYQPACSKGEFRNSTTNTCEECDYGFFQPKVWQDMCEECNTSYTTESKGSTKADQCRFKCPSGQENLSGTSCTDCKRGYYRTDSLADRFVNCTACNSTFTTPGQGSKLASDCNIRICNAGYYRNETENKCYKCPFGEYQPDSLQTMCLSCPDNTTTKEMGSENKSQCIFFCAAGHEVLSAESQTCQACERGYYKTNDGDNKFESCKKCDGNKTTDFKASESATFCDVPICQAGQHISNTTNTCEDCSEDYFQPENIPSTNTMCQRCPTGKGTLRAKQTSESACAHVCGAGQQYNSSSSQCEPCPMGTWNSGNSSQRFEQCAPCRSDYVTAGEMTGATSIANCTLRNCQAGTFIVGSDCTPCSVGYYQDVPRQTACQPCRTDTNTSGEGSAKESDCTVSCPAGKSQVSKTNETCVLCGADRFKPNNGAGTCEQCTGNFTSNDDRTECSVLYCDSGYEHHSGNSTCNPCEVGKYKVSRGNHDVCQSCPTNTTTAGQASTSPTDCSKAYCDVGLYSPNGTLPCLACPVGRYKNNTGNEECTSCTGASTTMGMGSTSATDCSVVVCPAGQFRQSNQCVNCGIGTFQNETGQTDCHFCPTGFNTTAVGSNSSDDCRIVCAAGKFRKDTTNMCMDCPKGKYQENTGQTSCSQCATNYTTASEASTSSTDCFIQCPMGQYSTSRTTCEVCPYGQYQSSSGVSSCDSCADGNTTLQTGSTSAADCQPVCDKGHYLNTSAKSCVACALGSYNPQAGNMTMAFNSCQSCIDGFTTSAMGSVSESQCNVEDCLPGTFRSSSVGCEPCPLETFQPNKSQSSCIDCPAGLTTLKNGRSSNESCVDTCEDGRQYDFVTKTCVPCSLGYYRQASMGVSCVKCQTNYTTLAQGRDDCVKDFDPQPKPSQEIVIHLKIRIRIVECTNKDHISSVISTFIINIFIGLDVIYPALCTNECTNVQIKLGAGCLFDYSTGQHAAGTEQLVNIKLTGVNDELERKDTSQIQETQSVVANAFYDIQSEQKLLDINELKFLGVENLTSVPKCQPGQFSDGSKCQYCGAGTYSTDGLSCSQCDMNSYQNNTGQRGCLPCPDKTFTSSMGSADVSNCTKKCDEPDARTTYCSGRGVCLFDATTSNGVSCECDDNYGGDICDARKTSADDKTKMIAGIVGGAGAFLLLMLLITGIVACLRRASQKGQKNGAGGPQDNKTIDYNEDGMSEHYLDYNYPLYDNGMRAMAGRPAIMYMNPAVDQDVRDFYSHDRSTAPPSRTRSRSYESEWRDVDGAL